MAQEKNDRRDDMPANERIVGPPLPEDVETDEEKYALEGDKVGLNEVAETVTGDEREIGRTGEGGLDHDTGRDQTLGRRKAPLLGAPTPGDIEKTIREQSQPRKKAC